MVLNTWIAGEENRICIWQERRKIYLRELPEQDTEMCSVCIAACRELGRRA